MVSKEQHKAFYTLEIQTQLEEWRSYVRKRMNLLVKDKELYIGRLWDINEEKGLVLIRFKRKEVPRLHWPYFFGLVGLDAVGSPTEWSFTYHDFLYSEDKNYWSRKGSDGNAVGYFTSDSDWTYLEVNFDDISFYELLKKDFFQKDLNPLFVVAKTYPPIAYLENLRNYIEHSGSNLLNLDAKVKSWNPIDIDNESVQPDYFINILDRNELTLIQGPPGTGKSYQAAAICDYYLKRNQSVAVCALTNKALVEIASQPGLVKALRNGLIFKTNISKDEQKSYPDLKPLTDFLPTQGNLLLTTYYKLSEFYAKLLEKSKRFDLLIIEEASQAFLATFAMFSEMANKILIIGDQKQLPPVVITQKKKLLEIHPDIEIVKNGLETVATNLPHEVTYRFTKTRRLTSDAAALTGLFYDDQLKSTSPLNGKILYAQPIQSLFHSNGGISIASVNIVGEASLNQTQVLERISWIVNEIIKHSTEINVAVLVPTVYLEQLLTQLISDHVSLNSRITISTIHRIQGITTDFTIYYMPLTNVHFELDPQLFNVATSRAKCGTLIITKSTLMINQMDKDVLMFLKRCTNVTKSFVDINI